MSPFAIASPKAIKEDVNGFWQKPVGTGPYKFVNWERNSQIRVEAVKDWWGTDLPESEGYGGPHVKKVVLKTIPDNTQRVAALTGNQINGADGLVPDDVPTVEEQEGFKVIFRPPNTIGYLAMNNEKPPFDDPQVRQAFNYAINIPQIVESVLRGQGEVASNYMPSLLPFFNNEHQTLPLRSRQGEADAEGRRGREPQDRVVVHAHTRVPTCPTPRASRRSCSRTWRKSGSAPSCMTYEWATYLVKTGEGEHPMCLLGWTGDNGDPDNFLNVLLNSATATPQNALNVAYYKNPEVDKLLEKAQTTVDENERARSLLQGAGDHARGRPVGAHRVRHAADRPAGRGEGLRAEPDQQRGLQHHLPLGRDRRAISSPRFLGRRSRPWRST